MTVAEASRTQAVNVMLYVMREKVMKEAGIEAM